MKKLKRIYRSIEAPLTLIVLLSIATMIPSLFNDVKDIVKSSLTCLASIICIAYFGIKYTKETEKTKKTINKLTILKIFIIGILTALFVNITLYYIATMLNLNTTSTVDDVKIDIIMIFTITIIQPIAEELCYRGMMRKELENGFSKRIVIILTTLIFALGHYSSITNIIYALILGYIMIKIYYKYDSLIFPIIFHIAANGLWALLSLIPEPSYSNAYFYLPAALIALIGLFVLTRKQLWKK